MDIFFLLQEIVIPEGYGHLFIGMGKAIPLQATYISWLWTSFLMTRTDWCCPALLTQNGYGHLF
jgi:hypothetical protein